MDTTDSGTPIASSDWDDVALGINQGALDGNLNFLSNLDSETDVALSISASNDSLESGSLTGLGLLLNRHDAHDLVGELVLHVGEKSVNDWGFFNGNGVGVDLFERLDLASLDESAELGEWSPLILVEAASSAWSASSASTASTSSTSTEASAPSSSSWSISCCCGCLSFHFR